MSRMSLEIKFVSDCYIYSLFWDRARYIYVDVGCFNLNQLLYNCADIIGTFFSHLSGCLGPLFLEITDENWFDRIQQFIQHFIYIESWPIWVVKKDLLPRFIPHSWLKLKFTVYIVFSEQLGPGLVELQTVMQTRVKSIKMRLCKHRKSPQLLFWKSEVYILLCQHTYRPISAFVISFKYSMTICTHQTYLNCFSNLSKRTQNFHATHCNIVEFLEGSCQTHQHLKHNSALDHLKTCLEQHLAASWPVVLKCCVRLMTFL